MFDPLRTWASRVWAALRMRRVQEEFDSELDSHAAMLVEENVERGLMPAEARRQALLTLGNRTQLREAHREQRGLPFFERVAQDARYALRMFRKNLGFTLFAGAALALGIGATTAVYSIADAVLLRPLPYRDPSRLVVVWEDDTAFGFPRNDGSPLAYREWSQRNQVFNGLAGVARGTLNLTGSGTPEQLPIQSVTGNFFQVLGVGAELGRTLLPDDSVPGSPATVVLGHGLWVRRFGADPHIVGQDVLLNGKKYTVAGIMPAGFQFLTHDTELWIATQWDDAYIKSHGDNHFLTMVARLKPGISMQQASAAMQTLGAQLKAAGFDSMTPVIVPLHEQVAGGRRAAILLLAGAMAFVLLIACANIANLLLARGSARSRELAVRLALGASRGRIVKQMLTESVILSAASGAAGVALAVWLTRFLSELVPDGIAPGTARVNGTVLLFAAAVSLATGMLFGILPALRSSHLKVSDSLKQGGGRSGVGAAGQRLRGVLVVAELSLSVVLLSGAALMIRSFQKLYHQDPGFQAEHVLTMITALPRPKYQDFGRRTEFYRDVVQRVESLPGVLSAGYSTWLPLAQSGGATLVTVENRPVDLKHMLIDNVRVVTPDYFRTIGMTLRRGRLLSESDGADAPKVVDINQTMARTYWPGMDPIGRRFKRGLPDSKEPWWTVVGIVADIRQGGMNVPVRPEAYFSYQQLDFFSPDALAIRTNGDPLAVAEEARRQVWAVDKDQPVADVQLMTDLVSEDVAPARLQATLLGGVAALALLLASLGIYAVLSFAVAQRTQEIGVRVALGARPADVLRMVGAHGLKLLGIGVAIGVTAALALSRLITHLLFGIGANDPLSYGSVVLLLSAVTLLACYLPARRAMRVDPMVALRYE